MRFLSGLLLLIFSAGTGLAAGIEMGAVPPAVTIKGDDGALVKDGGPWESSTIKDKIIMLVYVDPDEADTNEPLAERLKAEELPLDKFGSIAVINMAATWKPNMIISSILSGKQEKFPHTVYVKDLKKILVEKWSLADDAYNVLLFDRDGKLFFKKAGKFSDSEINDFVALVKSRI